LVAMTVLAGLSLLPSILSQSQSPMRKKLIYYGWGIRDTMFVREHWSEMEKMP